jgi:hypothetical protein
VRHLYGVELDLTSDTLPFLDQLIRERQRDPGGVRHLLAMAAGVYLGEVLRRAFGGLWHTADLPADPDAWTVRLLSCPLAIRPAMIGLEIGSRSILEKPSLIVPPRQFDALEGALGSAAPVSEEEYFSFCGRYDALHLVVDVLTELERLTARQDNRPPRLYGAENPADLI